VLSCLRLCFSLILYLSPSLSFSFASLPIIHHFPRIPHCLFVLFLSLSLCLSLSLSVSRQLVSLLNTVIGEFDKLAATFDCEKIKVLSPSLSLSLSLARWLMFLSVSLFRTGAGRLLLLRFRSLPCLISLLSSVPLVLLYRTFSLSLSFFLSFPHTFCHCPLGVLTPTSDHARNCVGMGLAMIDTLSRLAADLPCPVHMRMGVHCGPVISGVVGTRRYQFDVWSHAVTVANALESTGKPGMVCVCCVFACLDVCLVESSGPGECCDRGSRPPESLEWCV
jgi:hypothetical protein